MPGFSFPTVARIQRQLQHRAVTGRCVPYAILGTLSAQVACLPLRTWRCGRPSLPLGRCPRHQSACDVCCRVSRRHAAWGWPGHNGRLLPQVRMGAPDHDLLQLACVPSGRAGAFSPRVSGSPWVARVPGRAADPLAPQSSWAAQQSEPRGKHPFPQNIAPPKPLEKKLHLKQA